MVSCAVSLAGLVWEINNTSELKKNPDRMNFYAVYVGRPTAIVIFGLHSRNCMVQFGKTICMINEIFA